MINNVAVRHDTALSSLCYIAFIFIIDRLSKLCPVIHCLQHNANCYFVLCHVPVLKDQTPAQRDTGICSATCVTFG